MKQNKGKCLAGGDEVVQTEGDILTQSRPLASDKRKTISRTLDIGNLLSCRGNKKPNLALLLRPSPLSSKLIPFVPPTASNQPSTIPKANTLLPNRSPSSNPSTAAPLKGRLLTLLRSKSLAWERLQQAVTDKVIIICYDMSVKEFERPTIHDLFKVFSSVHSHMKN